MILRVAVGFARLSDAQLEAFGRNVLDKLTNNPAYPNPPVALATFKLTLEDFVTKLSAAALGSRAATAAKNAARQVLLDQLRRLALYVQTQCGNDLAMLLSSGFLAVNINHASRPLVTPMILKVLNEMSGQLKLRVTPIRNAHCYEVRYSVNGGPVQSGGVSTLARHIVVGNLTPGTIYTLQVRAIGGSTGASAWSDPISHMAL